LIIIRVVKAKTRVRGVTGTYRVVLQGVRGASGMDFFLGKFAIKRLKIALKTVKIYPY
jgi:alpha-D-ribose 1-methylphosphonate 5-triphosphate synthase subunit PhnG